MKYLFGYTAFDKLQKLIDDGQFSKVYVITDEHTKKYCLPEFNKFSFKFTNVNIKAGEKYKNIQSLITIWEQLLNSEADRKSLIINLGGGVVTDMGGFAAATFKRGIKFIHIPTTLLSMVDAAIGGKNGINFNGIKNQIGTIIQPESVIIYPGFLKTLPENELKSGYAEMLKHGLIADITYWNDLKNNYHTIFKLSNIETLTELIKKSVEIKNKVITTDPFEQGLRKVLNFGHTLGHAIETLFHYDRKQPVTHGEAVAIGMVLAAYISYKLLDFDIKKADEIKEFMRHIYNTQQFSKPEIDTIINYLIFDKKNENGKINFVLLEKIGKPVWNIQVPEKVINEAFEYYKT
jgi:3-dehydroquinate synthase